MEMSQGGPLLRCRDCFAQRPSYLLPADRSPMMTWSQNKTSLHRSIVRESQMPANAPDHLPAGIWRYFLSAASYDRPDFLLPVSDRSFLFHSPAPDAKFFCRLSFAVPRHPC